MGEKAFVTINGQTFQEGDLINDALIEKIENEQITFKVGKTTIIKDVGTKNIIKIVIILFITVVFSQPISSFSPIDKYGEEYDLSQKMSINMQESDIKERFNANRRINWSKYRCKPISQRYHNSKS